MKIAINIFILCCAFFCHNAKGSTFYENNHLVSYSDNDSSKTYIPASKNSIINHSWPECPQIEDVKLIELDDHTFLLKWDAAISDRIEYSVEFLEYGETVELNRNNSGVYIFEIKDGWSVQDLKIQLTSLCYFENRNEPIESTTLSLDWNALRMSSTLFCDAFGELIIEDHLNSFLVVDTKFPSNANFTFEICNDGHCQPYNHAQSNSIVLQKKALDYTYTKPKLYTRYGNFSCTSNRSSGMDPCDNIIVDQIENCLYQITYPETIEPVCDLGLYSHKLTHSLCGHATGRIIVNAKDGNEPYHYSWSTGASGFENDINHLLPGSYSVTVTDVTGCQVTSNINILERNSVNLFANGGDDGLQESLELPPGLDIKWRFNPLSVSDQCILNTGGLNIDTGPITRSTESACQNNASCSCSYVFMGDYDEGDVLPIPSGDARKVGIYAEGNFLVQSSGQLDVTVIGGSCTSGTGWTLKLECNSGNKLTENEDKDLSYVPFPEEVKGMFGTGEIIRSEYIQDSLEYFKELKTKPQRNNNHKAGSNNTTILDFRCSGHVASPYSIRMVDHLTGEIHICDIIDILSCPECTANSAGCEYVNYSLASDPWDPFCHIEWNVKHGINANLEIFNENGEAVMQSADNSGNWSFENGEIYTAYFTLENDTLSEVCSFPFSCPEPDLPPIDENLCELFNHMEVSLENESSLYFSSAANLTSTEIDAYNLLLSQISEIHLDMQWGLGAPLNNYPLFDAQNSGNANLFQLDPENMTFILDDYDMTNVWNQVAQGVIFSPDDRRMNFQLTITDIYGNSIECIFNIIVDFPEETSTPDNPLCLSCGDGIYDIQDDLGGFTLEQGENYDGPLEDSTIYIYGFPIFVTHYSTLNSSGQGILSLPFEECKVIAVELENIDVVKFPTLEKRLWIKTGEVQPNALYPSQLPNFEIAPDFNVGAEICIPPRGANDANGDGIDDETNVDRYGFDENGNHINGTKLDDNNFDDEGWFMGCPRTDDPELECTMYNEDGCDRDGLDIDKKPCPGIDEEEWNDFVEEFNESADSLISVIICDYANKAEEEKDEKFSECDSTRNVLNDYLSDPKISASERLMIKGAGDIYINEGMSGHFDSEPEIPNPSVGERIDLITNIERTHVDLYHCDLGLDPIEEEANVLGNLCDQVNHLEIQNMINQALDSLNNLEKQNLMLDENAFLMWVKELIKDYIENENQIIIGAVFPESIEINLFDTPTKAYYKGSYSATASVTNLPFILDDFPIMDAIDFEYAQGFDKINGVDRAFYVSQLGRYNQENFGAIGGQEPIAIQNAQNSSIFNIYVVNMRFYVNEPAKFDAYIELSDPKSDRKIYFEAKDITYNPDGLQEATMELATTIAKFKISNSARGTILKGSGTYLDFNCSGVQEVGINGEIEFCDNIIVPMQQVGNNIDYERHSDPYFALQFSAIFTEWLEFETSMSSNTPFAMAKHVDLIWNVENFSFDFSSSTSVFASNFDVPGGFQSEFVSGNSLGPGWKGFYCESLSAVLPAITKSNSGDRHVALNVSDLLIDKYGVTCSAEVDAQILQLGQPNMKSISESTGWSFSINYFRLDAVQNFIVGGGLRGKIWTSLFPANAESALDYTALVLPGHKYQFSVTPKSDLEIPLLVAKAKIDRSAIDVTYDAANDDFTAQAKFSGTLKVNNDGIGASLPHLRFTDLTITNKEPFILGGNWKLEGLPNPSDNAPNEVSGAYQGFQFSLDNIKFAICDGDPILATTINVGFGLNGDNSDVTDSLKNSSLTISGDFGLKGKFSPNDDGIQGFSFDSPFLNGLSMKGNIGVAVKDIDVKLCWDDDNPDYGDTFYGGGSASILDFGEVGIAAQFGRKDEQKYFFIDAFATLPTAFPIGGPIGIDEIGVGFSNNMSIQNAATGDGEPEAPEEADICSPSCAGSFGQTYTGYSYHFDPSAALALRASVGFGMLSKPKDFIEGTAGIDITFNPQGGISRFGFFGEATILNSFPGKTDKLVGFINEPPVDLLSKVDKLADKLNLDNAKPDLPDGLPIMARVEGALDFANNEFDLTAGAFLDWGVLKGAGQDHALVLGKIHIGDGWQVHLGTHRNPSGVILDLGVLDASFKTYFMSGNPLSPDDPWEPYLPDRVSEFFGGVDDFKFLHNFPSNGAGVAFGVHFEAGFDASVPVLGGFEARLMAGLDVAMINSIKCNGASLGMNGWYAMGQGYLYAGAGLKVLGVDLIKGEAGILMNAGLTNPAFFNGSLKVSGKFGVWPLRFTISGTIDVEVGDEPSCDWYVYDEGEILEVLGEINLVKSTFPNTESKNISTNLGEYIIDYSVAMGQVLELGYKDTLQDQTVVNRTIEYIADVSQIEFTSTKTSWSRSINPHDNGPSDIVDFNSTFASEDSIIVKITYNVKMKIPDTDEFVDIITEEVLEYNFKTGPLQLRFEPSNIASTWPENGMDNFYLGHQLIEGNETKGSIQFENSFPWELFQQQGLEVRSAIYQGDQLEPIHEEVLEPTQYIDLESDELTSGGTLFFGLPKNLTNGKHYKVAIYALTDTSEIRYPLMDSHTLQDE